MKLRTGCPLTLLSALWLPVLLLSSIPAAQVQDAVVGRAVLAAVTDPQNRPLVDLDEDDFVVHEDGEPREILSVRIADYPVVLIVDTGSHAAADLDAMKAAASRFARRIGEREVAVITTTSPFTPAAGFADDRETTIGVIESLTVEPVPHRPLQAVAGAGRLLESTESPFGAVVVLSAAGHADAEPGGLLTDFVESRRILHVVSRTAGQLPGEPRPSGPEDVLRAVAAGSGGRATAIYSPVSFQIALDQVADAMATEMIVEYVAPSTASDAADVRVGVAIPGTRVRGLGVWR